jgi:hypothetical protein
VIIESKKTSKAFIINVKLTDELYINLKAKIKNNKTIPDVDVDSNIPVMKRKSKNLLLLISSSEKSKMTIETTTILTKKAGSDNNEPGLK